MQRDKDSAELNEEAEALSGALDILTASDLVARGRLQEAETVLCRVANPPTSVQGVDMLARIAVQRGQFGRARELWKAILERDETNEAARAALARLDSPWLALALLQRVACLVGLALIIFMAGAGALALTKRLPSPASEPIPVALVQAPDRGDIVSTPPVVAHKEATNSLTEPSAPDTRLPSSAPEETGRRVASPFFTVPGCSVSTNRGETLIVFDEGIFRNRCELNEDARERLATLGAVIAKHVSNCWIIVEGHTDADPVSANSVFRDNYDLGLHRALAAVEILRAGTSFPAENLLATSVGESKPPFEGDDDASKSRNRTVVVRIVPCKSKGK